MFKSLTGTQRALVFALPFVVIITMLAMIYGLMQLHGGYEPFVEKTLGGAKSAVGMALLLGALAALVIYLWWLLEKRSPESGPPWWIHALVIVGLLFLASFAGLDWVDWSWGAFWTVPLLAIIAAAAIGAAVVTLWVYEGLGGETPSASDDLKID